MPLRLNIPGREPLGLQYLLLDANGTLSDRGELIDGVEERLGRLAGTLEPRLLSADTFGTLEAIAERLAVEATIAPDQDAKLAFVRHLGFDRCVAIGNGANDAAMLAAAALGIVVIGPEGAAGPAVAAADLICRSILDALDLLLEPRALAATLRR